MRYQLNEVSLSLFITFFVIYIAYNSIINQLNEARELTKWSWIVWTVYYGYMALYGTRHSTVMMVVSMFVASMGLIVAIGVSILFFLHASVILNGISLIGIGGVFIINLGQHFLPPVVFMYYVYYYRSLFNLYNRTVFRNCYLSAVVLSCSYVMLYILYMNAPSVYGVSISLYMFIWALPLISCVGIYIFVSIISGTCSKVF